MNGTKVHESCGAPQRIAHHYESHAMILWKAAGLLWVGLTSAAGHVLLVYIAGQKIGAW